MPAVSQPPPRRTIRQTIRLHRAQHDFVHATALYRGFVGGRGSGKSWAGAYDLLRRARRGRTYLVASPTSVLMQDTTFPAVKMLAQELGIWDAANVKLTPYPTATLTTGATLRFRTAEDPEKLRGPNLSGCWLDEASLMGEEAYKIAIACLREGGEQGWLTATFTPKGLTHWTHEVFNGDRENTRMFRAKTKDNPFNGPEFAKNLAGQYFGSFAAQELDGEFVTMEGAEWPAEFFGSHIWFDEWPQCPWTCRVLSLDPSKGKADKSGDYSAFIELRVDADWTLWVDADLDQTRPVEPLASSPERRSILEDGLGLYKATNPDAFIIETNGFQEMIAGAFARVSRERNLGLKLWKVDNTVNKQARIRTLGPYLAQRRMRIRNTRGGKILVQQMRDFPAGEHDDGPDALKTAEMMADKLVHSNTNSQVELLRS